MTSVNACGSCGALLQIGADSCLRCGGAAAVSRKPRAVGLMLGGAAVVAACTLVLLAIAGFRAIAATTSTGGQSQVVIQQPSVVAAPALTPIQVLQNTVAADRPTVEGLVGYWVPQVSSKKLGVVDSQGRTYDGYDDIVADYARIKQNWPNALLLSSDDYSSFSGSGYWVTVIGEAFPSAGGANAWCDAGSIPGTDCYAKRISHTGSPAGNTVHR